MAENGEDRVYGPLVQPLEHENRKLSDAGSTDLAHPYSDWDAWKNRRAREEI
jgi:hypothetical protein